MIHPAWLRLITEQQENFIEKFYIEKGKLTDEQVKNFYINKLAMHMVLSDIEQDYYLLYGRPQNN